MVKELDPNLVEKCPIIEELNPKAAEAVMRLLGPEVCIKYCAYAEGPGLDEAKAIEIEKGVFFEDRREDLGVYRIWVRDAGKWILFEEEPC